MKEYERVLADLQEREQLTDWEEGFFAGIRLYAWMKDGVYYVGTTGRTLEGAVTDYLRDVGKWPATVGAGEVQS